jgi:PmbA protein
MKKTDSNSLLLTTESLESIIADALEQARALGATSAEAGLSQSEGMSVSVRMREVETVEYQQDNGLGISVYFDQRKGSASTSSLDPEAIRKTVQAACDIARHTSEDPCTGLADAELMATEFRDLDLWHDWNIESAEAIELALACEAAALDASEQIINSDGASLDISRGISAYGNSHGFLHAERKTRYSMDCAVVGDDGSGMQRDYWYDVARAPEWLADAASIGRRAAERTLRRLGARKLPTGRHPVLFAPDMARSLIAHFNQAIGGNAQYRKASFLLDARGERVFPEFVQLTEQPYLKGCLGSANYDGEGVRVYEGEIVDEGVVCDYLLDSYAARKLGRQSNGNASGVHNLGVKDTGKDFGQLLSTMDRGLLVTELMGQGVSTVTGDYSRGAAGFWVEQGEIQYPVEEITIASNLRDMYRGIVDIGNDIDRRGNIHCGSILIDEMTVAGEG